MDQLKRKKIWVFCLMLVVLPMGLSIDFKRKVDWSIHTRENTSTIWRAKITKKTKLWGLKPPLQSCGSAGSKSTNPFPECNSKRLEISDCASWESKGGLGCYLHSATATQLYYICCPEVTCFFLTNPCPRAKWEKREQADFAVLCSEPDVAQTWHYQLSDVAIDTLFDTEINLHVESPSREGTEYMSKLSRVHSCSVAKAVQNLRIDSYGIGWIYFKFRVPPENCQTSLMYSEKYNVEGYNDTFQQDDISNYMRAGVMSFIHFHPCPAYPNWYCYILSENIMPYKNITIQVMYKRFHHNKDADLSPWSTIEARTDDVPQIISFCPAGNFFLSLWFLILLIVLFLLLLLIAAILIGVLLHRKKKEQKKEDMEGEYEEEKIPPTNVFEKTWERLKNFFQELCPSPKKPPPPPPPPPPKPKKKKPKKKKPKPKLKPKPKPKKKRKTPSPSPPPPPPPPPAPKKPRAPRTDANKTRDTAQLETKRMASGVGGVRGRRPRN